MRLIEDEEWEKLRADAKRAVSELFDVREELRKMKESQVFLRRLVFAIVKRYGDERGDLRLDPELDSPVAREPIILTHTDISTHETIVRATD